MKRTGLVAGGLLAASIWAVSVDVAPLGAQEWAGRGRLQGVLKDEAGQPVAGARLTFRKGEVKIDPATPGPAPVVSNDKGKWSIGGLAGGLWSVSIEKEGFLISEGTLQVNEYAVAQPVTITMKKPSKELLEQQAQAGAGAEIRAALEAGNAFLTQEKWAEARAEYEKALAKMEDPEYKPMVQRAVAQTYAMEKNNEKALELLEQAVASKPDDPDTLNMMGQVQYNLGQAEKAIETLKASLALKEDPTTTQLLVNLLVDAGREEESKTYLAKLGEGAKVDPISLLNVGIRLYNENKFDKALETYNRVVAENPDLPEAYYYRALVQLPLNKMKEAKADFTKFLELAPNHKNAADAREMLKSM